MWKCFDCSISTGHAASYQFLPTKTNTRWRHNMAASAFAFDSGKNRWLCQSEGGVGEWLSRSPVPPSFGDTHVKVFFLSWELEVLMSRFDCNLCDVSRNNLHRDVIISHSQVVSPFSSRSKTPATSCRSSCSCALSLTSCSCVVAMTSQRSSWRHNLLHWRSTHARRYRKRSMWRHCSNLLRTWRHRMMRWGIDLNELTDTADYYISVEIRR